MVGIQLTIFAFACSSAARSGIAILTDAMPKGPIKEPVHTTMSATVVTGNFVKELNREAILSANCLKSSHDTYWCDDFHLAFDEY